MNKKLKLAIYAALTSALIAGTFLFTPTAYAELDILCADGVTYVENASDCPQYDCPDGTTTTFDPTLSDCPAGTLCSDGTTVWPPDVCPILCWNGNYVTPPAQCPPEWTLCPDGSTVPPGASCPTEYCNGVARPNGGTRVCCSGSSVAAVETDDEWCLYAGAQQCRDRKICNPDGVTDGGTCSGVFWQCAVAVSNSCNDDEDCDSAIICLDGSTPPPGETCPAGGNCPDTNGNYDNECPLYECPDGVTTTHLENLSDCPEPTECENGDLVWPPQECPETTECSYEIIVEYGVNKLLYNAIYSEWLPAGSQCNPPSNAEIFAVVQYRLDPLPDQDPPSYDPDIAVDPADQCPGDDFPGIQTIDEYIAGGYTRDSGGFCVIPPVIDGECDEETISGCVTGTATPMPATLIDGTYHWTCEGSGGGTSDSCSKESGDSDGVCGGTEGTCTSGTPTPVPSTYSGGSYHWTCLGEGEGSDASCNGCTTTQNLCGGLLPNGTCSTEKYCPESGTCVPASESCTTASTTLITLFNMVPHRVATSTEFCQATWSATLAQDEDGNDIGGCTLNGVSVSPSSTASKAPGTYVFSCETNGLTDSKTSRCEVTPSVIER